MKNIYNIILELQQTPSLNDKKEILKKYINNKEWYKFLTYTLDEVNYVYGKSKLPTIAKVNNLLTYDSEYNEGLLMYSLLDDMVSGNLKGKIADEAIQDFLVGKPNYWEELMAIVLKRDLKAKVGVRIINEIYNRLIPISPYMRCEGEKKLKNRIQYPCVVQTKADGLFANFELYRNGLIKGTTRYGRKIPNCLFFDTFKSITLDNDYVLHGELLVKDDSGKILPREESNGLINAYVKKEDTKKTLIKKLNNAKTEKAKKKAIAELADYEKNWQYISENLIYKVWDIILIDDWLSLKSNVKYIDRLELLERIFTEYKNEFNLDNCSLEIIDYIIANNEEELMSFYSNQLENGEEGAVVKNQDLDWCHEVNRKGLIKMKNFKECDLLITGYNHGEHGTKFEDGIGSYICESSDGLLKVDVAGLSYKQKGYERVSDTDSSKGYKLIDGFNPEEHIGKIMAVKYNDIMISKKEGDKHSLFLPSSLEIREVSDKVVADDFTKIKKS